MARMTLELYGRRKTMLELYYAGAFNKTTFKKLAEQENASEQALRRDWNRRKQWEPLIWMAKQSEEDIHKLLYVLQIARERAVSLMRSADQDSVKVSAIGKLTEIIRREIELRQSLGLLKREPEKSEIELTGAAAMPWQSIPELQKVLAQIKERMESEKKAEQHASS